MGTEMPSNLRRPNRREFVNAGVGLSAAGLAALAAVDKLVADDVKESRTSSKSVISPGDTILFQGDSITDSVRKRGIAAANSHSAAIL